MSSRKTRQNSAPPKPRDIKLAKGSKGVSPDFSFAPDDQKHDPYELYVPKPEGVEMVPCAARLPPDLVALMQEIVQSGKFPHTTASDIIRSAVPMWLERAAPIMGKGFKSDLALTLALSRKSVRMRRLGELAVYAQQHIDALVALMKVSPDEAMGHWFELKDKVEELRDPYRSMLWEKLTTDPHPSMIALRRLAGQE